MTDESAPPLAAHRDLPRGQHHTPDPLDATAQTRREYDRPASRTNGVAAGRLPLALLVLGVLTANHHHHMVAANHLAPLAARFNRRSHFHLRIPSCLSYVAISIVAPRRHRDGCRHPDWCGLAVASACGTNRMRILPKRPKRPQIAMPSSACLRDRSRLGAPRGPATQVRLRQTMRPRVRS